MDDFVRETLRKQLQLLSERSFSPETSNNDLVVLSLAMVCIAKLFTDSPF